MAPDPMAGATSTALGLWEIIIPAMAALLGVVIGGVLQIASASYVARTQRAHRLSDEKAARDRDSEQLEADRKYVRATLARHLEAYARACAQAMWDNDDEELQGATNPPQFPDWPPDIAWELLSPNEMMAIRDIEVRVDLQREHVSGNVWHGAGDESAARVYYMDGAARIGTEAWSVSKRLRQKAEVDPFEFPSGSGNFADSLAEHVERLDEKARLYETRRAAKEAAKEHDLDG